MPFRPSEITRQHVLDACAKIKRENIQLRPSTRNDVIVNGEPFPPIEVLRYAHEQLDGDKRWEYSGGPQSFRYLEKLGFEVKRRRGDDDPIALLIERYKAHIKQRGLEDELYKWKLVGQFRGRPNLYADDFGEEIRSLNFNNLIYALARAVMVRLANERPERYRAALMNLFDENVPLSERIGPFQNEIQRIYREIDGNHSHHHDERTIAALLTFRNPENHTFYKDSFYKKLCELIRVKSKKTGKKLVHYLELIDDLVSEYIAVDQDLLSTVQSMLPEDVFQDANHKILAQDILFQMLEKSSEVNYWVFQANPKTYNLVEGLRTGVVDNWTVSAHRDRIRPGDKVILWLTGQDSGCYALAEVTEEPVKIEELADAHLWTVEDRNTYKTGIKVTHNLVTKPILKELIESVPRLRGLNVGLQGTNFTATKEQYEILSKLSEKKESGMTDHEPESNERQNNKFAKNIILYGPPGTGKTYNSIGTAVEIIDGNVPADRESTKNRFDELRQLGQIEFVTFHQNYSYEDFMVGIRPDVDNENLRFLAEKGIFYRVSKRARANYEESKVGKGRRSFDDVLLEILEPLERGEDVPVKMASGISFKITEVSDKSLSFIKQSGGKDHTLSISTLRDVVEGARDVPGGLDSYYKPLVKLIQQKRETTQPAEKLKNYVLVIDEINRANISKVFGELITLLEEDKRIGQPNELKVTLPNGEKDFGIPPNLYLIGTMNTADKSIALIDIALRRRFEFIGYYPRYDLIDAEAANLLREINDQIYKIKNSADYLIGHAYFMTDATIEAVLRNKVVPLLMEYLGGKTDVVKRIFDGTEWRVSFNTETYNWDISRK